MNNSCYIAHFATLMVEYEAPLTNTWLEKSGILKISFIFGVYRPLLFMVMIFTMCRVPYKRLIDIDIDRCRFLNLVVKLLLLPLVSNFSTADVFFLACAFQ